MEIPSKIQEILNKKLGNKSNIGLSGASVYIFDDIVLKIQPQTAESEREYAMMQWMRGKLPVPEIIEHINANKLSYLLMSKCQGKMACDQEYMRQPKYQAELLANALHAIWCIDYKSCPYNNMLDVKLRQAEYNVSQNLINMDDCEPETFSESGFKDPEALLYWLQNNKPEEELAVSHGDFCLPNIFFENGKMKGLIDLGRAGVADRWCDISLCYRSTKDNFSGKYGQTWFGYSDRYIFDALQMQPDWEKIRYYMLLDELF